MSKQYPPNPDFAHNQGYLEMRKYIITTQPNKPPLPRHERDQRFKQALDAFEEMQGVDFDPLFDEV